MDQKVIQIGSSIGVVLPAKDAREEGFKVGEIVSVTKEAGKFIIEKKEPPTPQVKLAVDPKQKKAAGQLDPHIVAWADDFIAKNRELLDRLKNK